MTNRQNRAPLLLIELMISIFLFAASAVAVVRIFAAAEKLSTRARNRSEAAAILQTAADAYIAADGEPEQTASLLGEVWNRPETASSAESFPQADQAAQEASSSAQLGLDSSAGVQTARGTLTYYFDKDWDSTVSSDSASFLLMIRFQSVKEKTRPGSAVVTISDAEGGVLLTQPVKQYQSARTEVSP